MDHLKDSTTSLRLRAVMIATAVALLGIAPNLLGQWAQSGSTINTGYSTGIGASPNTAYGLDVNWSGGGRFYTTTSVGFGGLTVQGDQTAYGNLLTLGSGRVDVYAGLPAANWSVFLTAGASSNGFIIETYTAKPLVFGVGNTEHMRIDTSGNIGINNATPTAALDINGNVNVSGNIAAKYQDVAEWVDSQRALDPGTVVVLDSEHTNRVEPSHLAYDTKVAGVVSATPGVLLGEPGDTRSKVATTGRVRVKVDATSHPIDIGDLLVTSDRTGYAMYSQPVQISGVKMHRPGTIIGKALEPLQAGHGEILVLLTLQ